DPNTYVLNMDAGSIFNNLNLKGNLNVEKGHVYAHGIHLDTGDYAEWFEKEGDARPGDLIGLNKASGKARKYQAGDHFLGVYSTNPAIVTNAQTADEEMARTHLLVGLLGQLDFDHSQTVIDGRMVKTLDGVYVGVLLSNGKVLIGR
ncbi:MAG: peptidase G2 autoproteolytic cleavage domain-containing protein, partial [Candidatus Sungiibacteriota bacterium]